MEPTYTVKLNRPPEIVLESSEVFTLDLDANQTATVNTTVSNTTLTNTTETVTTVIAAGSGSSSNITEFYVGSLIDQDTETSDQITVTFDNKNNSFIS